MSYVERVRKQIEAQKTALDELFRHSDTVQMQQRPSKKKWNALECVEHLNDSMDYYISQINKSIGKSKAKSQLPNEDYRPGFVGERFARLIAPNEGIVRMKVPTLPKFNPINRETKVDVQALNNFHQRLEKIDVLVQESAAIDLDKTRVRSPFGNILRFKLGDVFPIILAHNERHLLQARKALEAAKKPVSV